MRRGINKMARGVVCSKCGREVKEVCSNCWRCKDCGDSYCRDHMKRTINGHLHDSSIKK